MCGVTRLEDALAAAASGVDALGFNFWPNSPRYVDLSTAASIAKRLPSTVSKVGLFVNAEIKLIERVLTEVDLDFLQFHGAESREMCASFGTPYIKAILATSRDEIIINASKYENAKALLLDSHHSGQAGGSGIAFDWQIIPALDTPLILAGGLNPGNVADAIFQVKPCAVDVASGVESSKGIKEASLIRDFMSSVRQADRSGR